MNQPANKALPSPAAPTVTGLADKSLQPTQDKALHAEQDKTAGGAAAAVADAGPPTITVVLIHHWQDHAPGESVALAPEMANKLITGSFARLP